MGTFGSRRLMKLGPVSLPVSRPPRSFLCLVTQNEPSPWGGGDGGKFPLACFKTQAVTSLRKSKPERIGERPPRQKPQPLTVYILMRTSIASAMLDALEVNYWLNPHLKDSTAKMYDYLGMGMDD